MKNPTGNLFKNIQVSFHDSETDKNKYNEYIQVFVFFISNILYDTFKNHKNYNKIYDLEIIIDVEYENESTDSRGCAFAVGNTGYIIITEKEIVDFMIYFNNIKKPSKKQITEQIYITFLHELRHVMFMIEDYLKDVSHNLEYYHDIRHDKIYNLYNNARKNNPTISKMELSRLSDEELVCDYFAFQHIDSVLRMVKFAHTNCILI